MKLMHKIKKANIKANRMAHLLILLMCWNLSAIAATKRVQDPKQNAQNENSVEDNESEVCLVKCHNE